MNLDKNIHDSVVVLCKEGDRLFEKNRLDAALIKYKEALELLPKPWSSWEASVWIYVAIGDVYFYKRDFVKATDAFYNAYNGPDVIENPFVNLHLGQSLFEINQLDKAEDFLLRAYMLDGNKIFEAEDEKYLKYMRSKYNL